MRELKTLHETLEKVVKLRQKQGRDLYADIRRDEISDYYRLRVYNRTLRAKLEVGISLKCLTEGKAERILRKMFDTYPFNEPSPLEKLL